MRAAIFGLVVGTLLSCGISAAGQNTNRQAKPEQPTALTLSNIQPTGYFRLAPEIIAAAPPVLAVKVTKVVNPAKTAFQLFVYLAYDAEPGGNEPRKILVGNFGFYPPDQPGGHVLRASGAFQQLKASGPHAGAVRVVFEMRRLYEAKPWTTVELTIAPPEWRAEPKN